MGHAKLAQGPDFIDHLKKSTLQAALNTGLTIAIEGTDPAQALRQGLLSAGVNTFAGFAASQIGLKRSSLDYTSHKLLHGVVGGLKAKLLGKDALAGAAGAMLAEVLGEALVKDASTRLPELYAQAAEKGVVDREAIEKQYQGEVEDRLDLARLGTAGAALLGGLEVSTAYDTADNALKHNLLPTVIWGAVAVGGAAWTAYDVYDTYVTEGVEAAVQQLAIEGTIMLVAGGTFKVAGKLYPTAELAWAAALKYSPMLQKMVQVLDHGKTILKETALTKQWHKVNYALEETFAHHVQKWTGKSVAKETASGAIPVSEQSLMMRQYLREMETITGVPIATEQRLLLKSALKEQKFVKIEGAFEKRLQRDGFNKMRDNLILEWEVKTGQKWPKYESIVWNKKGDKVYKKIGEKYDAHEIIPNSHGGPLEWWNITPARSPDQHQKLIHGSGSSLNKILRGK
jgi:hypothetical protein